MPFPMSLLGHVRIKALRCGGTFLASVRILLFPKLVTSALSEWIMTSVENGNLTPPTAISN